MVVVGVECGMGAGVRIVGAKDKAPIYMKFGRG